MMNVAEHIKDNEPWSVEKEWELIRTLGGATKWGGDYFITNRYEGAVAQIDEAMKKLAKDSTTDPQEFAQEMNNMDW